MIYFGRILSEPNFKAAEGDKKAFASFSLALNTKKSEDGTYKSDFIRCKAFGYAAERINETWSKEEDVVLEGNLVMGQDYTDSNGELVTGSWELIINKKHEYNTLCFESQGDRIIRGKIANFENAIRYYAGSEDKKSLAYVTVSVSKGYKKEGEEYYKEELKKLVLFGNAADAVNENYQKGDFITVIGRAQAGKDYTNNNGDIVDGGEEILVNRLHGFAPVKKNETSRKSVTPTFAKSPTSKAPAKTGTPNLNKMPSKLPSKGLPGKKIVGLTPKKK